MFKSIQDVRDISLYYIKLYDFSFTNLQESYKQSPKVSEDIMA